MDSQENDRVKKYFETSVLEWPCPSFADRVLFVPVSDDPALTGLCAFVLSDSEIARTKRFVTEADRVNFIQRRAFRRYLGSMAVPQIDLKNIEFAETANGRPYLKERPDVWFSFSSCRTGFLGAFSSTCAIGIDVEDEWVAVEVSELAERYFTPAESDTIAKAGPGRSSIFLKLWSLKEAALKSIGEGLPFGMDQFSFELNDNLRITKAPASHGGPYSFMPHLYQMPAVHASIVGRHLIRS